MSTTSIVSDNVPEQTEAELQEMARVKRLHALITAIILIVVALFLLILSLALTVNMLQIKPYADKLKNKSPKIIEFDMEVPDGDVDGLRGKINVTLSVGIIAILATIGQFALAAYILMNGLDKMIILQIVVGVLLLLNVILIALKASFSLDDHFAPKSTNQLGGWTFLGVLAINIFVLIGVVIFLILNWRREKNRKRKVAALKGKRKGHTPRAPVATTPQSQRTPRPH